ncbi:hypothetical protein [Actinocorallia herbida]|uniref:hypothetical protein n=1 Tax=Actinocorallia herbida TaxID=58109 RepID=UPI000F4C4627|nr:hypothetical protein [Actinocorallia herbida]
MSTHRSSTATAPIAGLHAPGNTTASVTDRAYPAGGAGIGATEVFAPVAAEIAASVSGRGQGAGDGE